MLDWNQGFSIMKNQKGNGLKKRIKFMMESLVLNVVGWFKIRMKMRMLVTSPTPRMDSVTPLMIPRLAITKSLKKSFQTSSDHLKHHIASPRRSQKLPPMLIQKPLKGPLSILRIRIHNTETSKV